MTQSKIVAKIRKLGYKVTVLNASARNRGGIFDIIIALDGFPALTEIKIDKDKLSKLQKDFMDEFHKATFVLHYDSKRNLFECDVDERVDSDLFRDFLIMKCQLNDSLNAL